MKQVNGWYVPDSDLYFDERRLKPEGFDLAHLNEALKYVRRWNLAVDVGAHIGTMTKAMASVFSKVIAIEPASDVYSCLLRNTDSLPNVTPYKFALGELSGEVAMRDSVTRPGNTGARYIAKGYGTPMRTLDSMGLEDVGLIKIDVEGAELLVVHGGYTTITKHRPVILIEQKKFKDTEGRVDIPHTAAVGFLAQIGMKQAERIKNDIVMIWE